ncbi:MAG: exodeoxyribonuclease VII large subunit [Tenericutes bacterium HGW-Tenericutes-5]|jgi:exodeoxyribonuclease VII large subunit|nr:MAG: exodeoxyribonuclease VII large subunit [Tenericutes bacterium HGW-Tenericutes-5]
MVRQYLTVSALNRYLKYKLDNDSELQNILLKAEISNFKRHSRGHLYLSLKDDNSSISAIMFVSNTARLNFNPKDGDKVIVEGYISVYEAYGTYQIYIQKMDLDGVGDLYLAYERLKEDLAKKGYFKEEHKKALPKFPKTVGVITSPTGAAVRDIINVIGSRFPLTKIIVYPALVQGVNAKESIVEQIEKANNQGLVDVLIVGRGGGSIEDLWAFNEEVVAEAIYNSKIPVISAVGHETDFTIADFVADVRASTPSHAAEIAVKNYRDVLLDIESYQLRMKNSLGNLYNNSLKHYTTIINRNVLKNPRRLIEAKELYFSNLYDRLVKVSPVNVISNRKERILNLEKQLKSDYRYQLNQIQSDYNHLLEKLELVNPLNIMKKGFAIVKQDDLIKKHISEIDKFKHLKIEMSGGEITAIIKDMRGKE